jgi:phage/plasmid-associated DNA primase
MESCRKLFLIPSGIEEVLLVKLTYDEWYHNHYKGNEPYANRLKLKHDYVKWCEEHGYEPVLKGGN